jgi:hypothetical protein
MAEITYLDGKPQQTIAFEELEDLDEIVERGQTGIRATRSLSLSIACKRLASCIWSFSESNA